MVDKVNRVLFAIIFLKHYHHQPTHPFNFINFSKLINLLTFQLYQLTNKHASNYSSGQHL
jgi:hypothetical protein